VAGARVAARSGLRGGGAGFDVQLATTLAYYSASSYCDGTQIGGGSWSCLPCANTPTVVASTFLSNSSMDVYGTVAKQSDGIIVVAFRGTDPLDLKNWVDDIWYFPTSLAYPGCTECEVHAGFYAGYLELAGQMKAAVDAYGGVNAPGIMVTGHSLGGAMSQLAVFELLIAGYPVTTHIDFGRPRVGNPAFAAEYYAVVNADTSRLRLNHAATAPWSPLLTAAARRAHVALGASATTSLVASSVRTAAAAFAATPAAASRTRAARHAANAAVVGAVRRDVAASLRFTTVTNGTTAYRVTHNADPVPHLPLEAMGFAHPPTEVWYDESGGSYRVCSATNGEDPTCSDSLPLDIDLLDHLWYMNIDIALLCGL